MIGEVFYGRWRIRRIPARRDVFLLCEIRVALLISQRLDLRLLFAAVGGRDAELRAEVGHGRGARLFARHVARGIALHIAVEGHELDDAAILLERRKLFVVHIAAVIADRAHARMRRHDRRFGDGERLQHRLL